MIWKFHYSSSGRLINFICKFQWPLPKTMPQLWTLISDPQFKRSASRVGATASYYNKVVCCRPIIEETTSSVHDCLEVTTPLVVPRSTILLMRPNVSFGVYLSFTGTCSLNADSILSDHQLGYSVIHLFGSTWPHVTQPL